MVLGGSIGLLGWCWVLGYACGLLGTLGALVAIYRGGIRGGR